MTCIIASDALTGAVTGTGVANCTALWRRPATVRKCAALVDRFKQFFKLA